MFAQHKLVEHVVHNDACRERVGTVIEGLEDSLMNDAHDELRHCLVRCQLANVCVYATGGDVADPEGRKFSENFVSGLSQIQNPRS